MRTRLVAGAAASLVAAAVVSALAAAQAGGGPEPVTVSFLAIDRDGKPVLDLKSDEVQLRLNGRQRTIRSLAACGRPERRHASRRRPASALRHQRPDRVRPRRPALRVRDRRCLVPAGQRSAGQTDDRSVPENARTGQSGGAHDDAATDDANRPDVRRRSPAGARTRCRCRHAAADRVRGRLPHARHAGRAARAHVEPRRGSHAGDGGVLLGEPVGKHPGPGRYRIGARGGVHRAI